MKKLANTYVKYVAKKPVLFLGLLIVSVAIIMILTLTTKTNLVVTYDAVIDEECIRVNDAVTPCKNFLYVYSNRNEYVYRIEMTDRHYDEDSTTFSVIITDELTQLKQQDIQVDIPVKEISLFERIFLRGGKANEQ